MSTSPGARGGASVLEIAKSALPQYGGSIKATFSLPSFNDNFDVEKGIILNEELDEKLKEIVENF